MVLGCYHKINLVPIVFLTNFMQKFSATYSDSEMVLSDGRWERISRPIAGVRETNAILPMTIRVILLPGTTIL